MTIYDDITAIGRSRAAMGRLRTTNGEAFAPPLLTDADAPGSGRATTASGTHLTFRTLREWQDSYRPPQWLIRGFLMADAFDVFGGAEKSLKSWLMHHCAIAVAAGVPLFMNPEFEVPKSGTVLLLTGEGGVDLVQDRIRHLCEGMYGLDYDDVADRIVVSDDIAPMTSKHFIDDVSAAISEHDPVLFQLDPLYVYFGEDREAGNVFSTGPALMGLRLLTRGRANQMAHHFTKSAADKLTLASLTQAGMREAVDHWLLIAVDKYDLDAQRFELRLERGARRGLAWSKRAEVVLGPFDTDTLLHSGTPSVTLLEGGGSDASGSSAKDVRACAVQATRLCKARMAEDVAGGRAPQGLTSNWLVDHIDRKCRRTTKLAGLDDAVLEGAIGRADGPRKAVLHFYVRDYPLP